MSRVRRLWSSGTAFLQRRPAPADLAVLVLLAGLLYLVVGTASRLSGRYVPHLEIDLSLRALPGYALMSLSRGLAAYALSLAFTLSVGYWAARDRLAERILVPAVDILQSIPVLGFLPGVVMGMVSLVPGSNVGLELASVVLIFTGQVWNMLFSFYQSLRILPRDLDEVAKVYGFSWWQRFCSIELPCAAVGLVWNSMLSMAGGWFFLMACESFRVGAWDFRLPGLGSYMGAAVAAGDRVAMAGGVAAMLAIIVLLDQLLWRPAMAWSQKFRLEESGSGEQVSSWFLTLLRRSLLVRVLGRRAGSEPRAFALGAVRPRARRTPSERAWAWAPAVVSRLLLLFVCTGALAGLLRLYVLLGSVTWQDWLYLFQLAGLTQARVLLALAISTAWAVPAGLAVGLSPRLSGLLQPVIQVIASFPAPLLFPVVVALFDRLGVGLGLGSVALMLLGTQWYILFNVVAGAMAIPGDLRECARAFGLKGWRVMWCLYLPAVFPYLVTGWVTAAGGAWNASIVAEYVALGGRILRARGLGALVTEAAERAEFGLLAAGVLAMAGAVVLFNRLVWRRLYRLAEERFSLAAGPVAGR